MKGAMPSPLAAHAVTPSLALDGDMHVANVSAIEKDIAPDAMVSVLGTCRDTAMPYRTSTRTITGGS
jgi:hypothetical protein